MVCCVRESCRGRRQVLRHFLPTPNSFTTTPERLQHTQMFEPACREILLQILNHKITSDRELDITKKRVSAKYKLPSLPKNSDILALCSTDEKKRVISCGYDLYEQAAAGRIAL